MLSSPAPNPASLKFRLLILMPSRTWYFVLSSSSLLFLCQALVFSLELYTMFDMGEWDRLVFDVGLIFALPYIFWSASYGLNKV